MNAALKNTVINKKASPKEGRFIHYCPLATHYSPLPIKTLSYLPPAFLI
jgi:hypothetical protein